MSQDFLPVGNQSDPHPFSIIPADCFRSWGSRVLELTSVKGERAYHVPYRYRCGRSRNTLIMSTPATKPPICAQKAIPPEV